MEALLRPVFRRLHMVWPRSLHYSKRDIASVTAAQGRVQDICHHPPGSPLPVSPPPPQSPTTSTVPRTNRLEDAKPFSHFLTDNFHRQHTYLRISVTERCNLRCTYCMPADGVPLSPPAHLLTTPEIVYISELFVKQGVTKIRLTGGEPTVRKDILPLMHEIGQLRSKGLKELCLTTNGISLHRKLDAMVDAGLTGVNLSLDTLDPYQFQIMTRRKGFDAVMKSLERILEMNRLGAGIKLKLNVVVMRDVNEREIVPFVELGRENNIEVRFIEYMPFDGNKWCQQKMLSYKEMVAIIRQKYPGLCRLQEEGKNETSKTWQVPGFKGKIGFITSMTENFCGTCNRLRITADGNLKVCLFGNSEVSLRDLLRKENDGEPVDWAALEAMTQAEMERQQQSSGRTGPLGYGERERNLLEVIGLAVKRKKERHAGMENEVHPSSNTAASNSPIHWPAMRRSTVVASSRNGLQSALQLSDIIPSSNLCKPHISLASVHTSSSLRRQVTFERKKEKKAQEEERKAWDRTHPKSDDSSVIGKWRMNRYAARPENTPKPPSAGPSPSNTPPTAPQPRPKFSSIAQTASPQDPPPSLTPPNPPTQLPHLTSHSTVHQISISHKPITHRAAVAVGFVRFSNPDLLSIIQRQLLKKGDVLAVARIAGITAVKRTADLIPLAHAGVAVESCTVDLELATPGDSQTRMFINRDGGDAAPTKAFVEELMRQPLPPHGGLRIRVKVGSSGKTGVEMEALCGVAGAALSVVDMCKAVDKHLTVDGVAVAGKKGGKGGSCGVCADGEDEEEGNRRLAAARKEDLIQAASQQQQQQPPFQPSTDSTPHPRQTNQNPPGSSRPTTKTTTTPRAEARTFHDANAASGKLRRPLDRHHHHHHHDDGQRKFTMGNDRNSGREGGRGEERKKKKK
ncbi:MAG: hypothetical protein Q9173_005840 [Seirophora scorigena]